MKLDWTRSLAAVPLAVLHIGCGAMFRDVAKEVTPAVVAGAVKGLAKVLGRHLVGIDEPA